MVLKPISAFFEACARWLFSSSKEVASWWKGLSEAEKSALGDLKAEEMLKVRPDIFVPIKSIERRVRKLGRKNRKTFP